MTNPQLRCLNCGVIGEKILRFALSGAAVLMCSAGGLAIAIEIQIDYSLDTNGFFTRPGSKQALRAICDYFESILDDDLAEINESDFSAGNTWIAKVNHPATGALVNFPHKVVPRGVFILYAGGRANLGSAGVGGTTGYSANGSGGQAQLWFDLLKSRGQPGALASSPTDFGPWGGTIVFNASLTWNFSLTESTGNGSDFVSIALHEVGHALGLGTAPSWNTHVSGNQFYGGHAMASFGRPVPLQPGGSHWQDDGICQGPNGHDPTNPLNVLSQTLGIFGVPAGRDQIALMDPSGCRANSYLRVLTQLDVAALADMGWELKEPVPLMPVVPDLLVNYTPTKITLSWLANPQHSYQVQESTQLSSWQNLGAPISGQTGMTSYIDQSPPVGKNFYRLEIGQAPAPAALIASPLRTGVQAIEANPVMVDCKGHCGFR